MKNDEPPDAQTPPYQPGLSHLSDEQLLYQLFRSDRVAESLARRGDLQKISGFYIDDLMKIPSIGRVQAERFIAAVELGRRIAVAQASKKREARPMVRSSRDAYELLKHAFIQPSKESIIALHINVRGRVVELETVAMGTIDQCPVSPSDLFRRAIILSASQVIVGHNHPSGEPSPSPQDQFLTLLLQEASEVLGLRLLDHIIVGDGDYYSFRDSGLL